MTRSIAIVGVTALAATIQVPARCGAFLQQQQNFFRRQPFLTRTSAYPRAMPGPVSRTSRRRQAGTDEPISSVAVRGAEASASGDRDTISPDVLISDEESPADAGFPPEDQEAEPLVVHPSDPVERSMANLRFGTSFYDLGQASIVGVLTGLSVALFKLSIETLVSFQICQASEDDYEFADFTCLASLRGKSAISKKYLRRCRL